MCHRWSPLTPYSLSMSRRPNRSPVVSDEIAALVAEGDDADLLAVIAAERERDREWASAALMELYRRHVRPLYAICRRICSRYLGDDNVCADLLNRTMWKVYRVAERFDRAKAGCESDRDRTSAAVFAWMCQWAKWLAKDVLASAVGRDPQVTGGSEEVNLIGSVDEEPVECSDEVRQALELLPERDRHIVLAFFFATDGDSGGPVPPGENIDIYCARRWGITATYVRKIRERSLAQLREYLSPAFAPTAPAR